MGQHLGCLGVDFSSFVDFDSVDLDGLNRIQHRIHHQKLGLYTVKLDEFRRTLSFAWSYVSTDFHLAMGGDKAKDFYEEFLAQLRDGDSTKMLANWFNSLFMIALMI